MRKHLYFSFYSYPTDEDDSRAEHYVGWRGTFSQLGCGTFESVNHQKYFLSYIFHFPRVKCF